MHPRRPCFCLSFTLSIFVHQSQYFGPDFAIFCNACSVFFHDLIDRIGGLTHRFQPKIISRTFTRLIIRSHWIPMRRTVGPVQQFLDAPSHLYKRSCLSIGPSVRRSVGPSVPRYFRRWKVHILGASCAVYPALLIHIGSVMNTDKHWQ